MQNISFEASINTHRHIHTHTDERKYTSQGSCEVGHTFISPAPLNARQQSPAARARAKPNKTTPPMNRREKKNKNRFITLETVEAEKRDEFQLFLYRKTLDSIKTSRVKI